MQAGDRTDIGRFRFENVASDEGVIAESGQCVGVCQGRESEVRTWWPQGKILPEKHAPWCSNEG